jgi:hypothetical protein
LVFFCIINFTATTFLCLFLPPSVSLLLLCYNSLYSLPTTLSAPSHSLSPIFTSLSYPPPTCQHTNPPSYTLTTHWLDNCTNYARPWPPAIPDTSTFHYNRNIPKHAQGPQNPAVPFLSPHLPTLFPTPLLVPHLPISQISISSLITITLPNSH